MFIQKDTKIKVSEKYPDTLIYANGGEKKGIWAYGGYLYEPKEPNFLAKKSNRLIQPIARVRACSLISYSGTTLFAHGPFCP